MPSDWGARLVRREVPGGSRRRIVDGVHRGEIIPSHPVAPSRSTRLAYDRPVREPREPDWPEGAGQVPIELSFRSPPQARELSSRLTRWRPAVWPLVVSYLVDVVCVGWYTLPSIGLLAWPLTVMWTWPILTTLIGIVGIRRTRKALRKSEARWPGPGLTRSEDFLIVVLATVGRHDIFPALERSVVSYLTYLPRCFPRLRVDIVIDEGCEATSRIIRLAAGSDMTRLVTVPMRYHTANGTRFKARASHYSHELRIREHEARDDVWVLHMD